MKAYELVLIFNPNLGEEKISEILGKIESKIKGFGGEVEKADKMGIKRLASTFKKAKKLTQGYYVVVFFSGEATLPGQISAYLKVTENIVRYSVLQAVPKEDPEIAGKPVEAEAEAVNVGEIREASSGQS
ncbi:MAG: 30S ribosomal protein S6 [Candidatus Margulisiibacteriota bacterium]|nr:30S ribosomal protein S6 [Candidatus Margulisiibacteriota bacterium]